MRRALLPVILAVLTVGAAVGAFGAADAAAPPEALGRPASTTPVLSARRVPALVAGPVADRRLVTALADVAARSPASTCLTATVGTEPLFTHQADLPLVPASTEKLPTALAALEVLGPDATFTTRVVSAAPPAEGVVAGDLWLVGAGDPLLANDAYVASFEDQPQLHTDLEALADAVVASGVRQVQGRIVGDESRFDAARYVTSWPLRYAAQNQTGPLSALTVNDGFVAFPPAPEAPGEEVPAPDPPTHAAAQLTVLLAQRGVVVGGPPVAGPAPAEVAEVAAVSSPPMAEVVGQMLRESDNMSAELLLKAVGAAAGEGGNTAGGAAVVNEVLATEGLPTAEVVVVDGSGLDGGNRLTCELLDELLLAAGPESILADGLAVAGEDGTLEGRFTDTEAEGRLLAKTGSLRNVTALAGFVTRPEGPALTFAYVANAPDISADTLALQAELGTHLAAFPAVAPLDQLGPRPIEGRDETPPPEPGS